MSSQRASSPSTNNTVSDFAIIVPAIGEQSAIDETLVSILESRSPMTRVIVPCDQSYEDPYQLADEVDFLRCNVAGDLGAAWRLDPFRAWTTLANEALYVIRQPFFGLFLPGVHVPEQSIAVAVEQLQAQSDVACVSPTVRRRTSDATFAFAGVTMQRGRRIEVRTSRLNRFANHEIVPSWMAGFFRTSALLEVGGWNSAVHPQVADIELATRLFQAGYESQRTESELSASGSPNLAGEPYRLARDQQQIHREFYGYRQGIASLRPVGLLTEFLKHLGSGAISTLAGRLAGAYGNLPTRKSPMAYQRAA